VAADNAAEIVKQSVGSSPYMRIYQIHDQPTHSIWLKDEICIQGSITTHKFVERHADGHEFERNLSRYTSDTNQYMELICNDPIAAMRIAMLADTTQQLAINVNGIRIYTFTII
jgi:hypothetical protein